MQEVHATEESAHSTWSAGPSAAMWCEVVEVRAHLPEVMYLWGHTVQGPKLL